MAWLICEELDFRALLCGIMFITFQILTAQILDLALIFSSSYVETQGHSVNIF